MQKEHVLKIQSKKVLRQNFYHISPCKCGDLLHSWGNLSSLGSKVIHALFCREQGCELHSNSLALKELLSCDVSVPLMHKVLDVQPGSGNNHIAFVSVAENTK